MNNILRILKFVGFGLLSVIFIFFCFVFFPLPSIDFDKKAYDNLLIENINIIDVENDTLLQNHYVLISISTIKSISAIPISHDLKNLHIINGKDKHLIPALWDMHAHLIKQSPNSAYPEYVINGIMHLRDMRGAYDNKDPFASTPERINKWNQMVHANELLGPKVHSLPSFAVKGPSSMFDGSPEFFNCSNETEAQELVNYFNTQKINLIKTYNNIPREAFFTLMKEAQLAGIDVAGHKPVRVSTVEASNAGIKSLEHARFLLWDSFKGSDELRNDENPKRRDNTALRKKMLAEHNTLMLHENLEAMKANHTFYCPTHLTRKSDAFADDSTFRARYDNVNPILRFLSFEDLDATIQEDTSSLGRLVYKKFYLKGLEITKTANKKGVKILAGADLPELPGSSLIDELQELSAAGLSGFDVLKTATLYPAEYFKVQDKLGTVSENKTADLVILSKNPLDKASNLKSIDGIIYNGRYINIDNINQIKEKVYSRNQSWSMSAKLIWDIILYMTK
ncbi:amidohydrolase family protein [Arcticibacterium luteifluviistationis]|uniref:Amidohydrolase-related domain-containing protein n=1 Tax=Arcticibacterium luteifluviistationis TaxID=1784714 RepID=A0A2Z4GCC1_9BACT|nr:amidohydrolase family protein [Arcticibacterium luteifluviistationis]AWV98573.1 hypothetical protein DJ013_10490 [Arcticibacterium luteifluviistationis]